MANAGIFDGGGSTLRLGNTDQIQMKSEIVEIRFRPADGLVTGSGKHRDVAEYRCYFILENLSDETITAQIGFPLITDTQRPLEEKVARRILERREFSAKSGDTVFRTEYVPESDQGEFGSVFIWEMEFPPRSTVPLEVSYQLFGYIGAWSTRNDPRDFENDYIENPYLATLEGAFVQSYPYVTRTGQSWAEEIEEATFIVHHEEFLRHLQERGAFEEDPNKPREFMNEEIRARYAVLSSGAVYLNFSGGEWALDESGKCFVLHEKPFSAAEDIEVSFVFSILPKNSEALEILLARIQSQYEKDRESANRIISEVLENSSERDRNRQVLFQERWDKGLSEPFGARQRKNVADVILEFYGIKTNNPAIENFLNHQSWYPVTVERTIDPELEENLLALHSYEKKLSFKDAGDRKNSRFGF